MRAWKMVGALTVCMVMVMFSASGADANWIVNGSELGTGSRETTRIENFGSVRLEGSVLGSPVTIEALGVQCWGSCAIEGSSYGTNSGESELLLSGVTVTEPVNCEVPLGTLITEPLEERIVMASGGTETFDRIFPRFSSTFLVVPFAGPFCPLSEVEVPLKGVLYGEVNATGVGAEVQPVVFNFTSNSLSSLTFGESAATLSGELTESLATEAPFWVNE